MHADAGYGTFCFLAKTHEIVMYAQSETVEKTKSKKDGKRACNLYG